MQNASSQLIQDLLLLYFYFILLKNIKYLDSAWPTLTHLGQSWSSLWPDPTRPLGRGSWVRWASLGEVYCNFSQCSPHKSIKGLNDYYKLFWFFPAFILKTRAFSGDRASLVSVTFNIPYNNEKQNYG